MFLKQNFNPMEFNKRILKELNRLTMAKKINISIIGTRGYPYVYGGYETFVKEIKERLSDKL